MPPRGEARNDLEIALGLYEKMQARGAVTKNFLPWKSEDDFIEYLLGDSGITLETLRRDGYATYPYTLDDFENDFRPRPGRSSSIRRRSPALASIRCRTSLRRHGTRADAEVRSKFPLTLLTGDREKTYHHSRFRDQPWAKKISPDPRLLIHPKTAREMSVDQDQWVRIETPGAAARARPG